MWILALKFNKAKKKQAKVEIKIPTKKKYNSIISVGGNTRLTIKIAIEPFNNNGNNRSFVLFK
ncbi:hypothetical protein GCM10010976_02600 [Bizionia arctica]|uniref:Uncharacterized protein n=1 Tax=Bizionia arctica TaxID=1495645 RepID=A0A917GAU7_9FLAO|nr:hypothetical protein GCM10010976_02600 [Bizionia arctica]